MSDRPTGTVTFLFTDIEGSTRRWETHPTAMSAAVSRHEELVRQAVEASGGVVFKTVGDSVCAVFRTAPEALVAAIAAQRALGAEDWSAFGPGFGPLETRMGLHTGAAEERDGDYYGQPLNRCARLHAVGHGGQILVSLATQQLLRDRLAPGQELRDLGEHRLRDLTNSEHIFQLVAADLPDVRRQITSAERLHVGDRVVVDDSADAGGVRDALAARRRAALDETASATLTPEQLLRVLEHRPADLESYRLSRIAKWSQPRHRLDGRFVALELLVDRGEQSLLGRWEPREETYDDLGAVMADHVDAALVVLGPPGVGKSTLLRRLELDIAVDAVRARAQDPCARAGADKVTFFVQLNRFKPGRRGADLPDPGEWLAERWAVRYPDLPPLPELLTAGRMVLLLDGLNELPLESEARFREAVGLWKDWLHRLAADTPGNRVIFSCRSLDYSQPLSTPSLRVPQVRVEPLSDERVREFLSAYCPLHWRSIWPRLENTQQLAVMRSPYFLRLLTDQVETSGEIPEGRAGLFTGFVRQTMRREVEQGNPMFDPGELVTGRDLRRITHWRWRGQHDLPENGVLLRQLGQLALRMQGSRTDGEQSQVRVSYDEALDMLDAELAADVIRAGVALSVLDEDPGADEVMFVHQLVQEYFAAREIARAPDPELVRVEWRADRVRPSMEETLVGLDPADALPPLRASGWEETTLLASAMTDDPEAFVGGVAEANLALAGGCASQPEVLARLSASFVSDLRQRLVERAEDEQADLRHRIACARTLAEIGDPRFERRSGPFGDYLMPPLAEIPTGRYPIGEDEPIEWSWSGARGTATSHMPRHEVAVAGFRIGRFPATNAEWALFMAAGGYDDEAWWETADARAWRRGEMANEGAKANNRIWRSRFKDDPGLLDTMVAEGRFPDDAAVERWRHWMELDDAAFEEALSGQWQPKRETEPEFWRDERFNHPSQPVVGITWYEARAYCAWLSAQTGLVCRLPTEVEREAMARGLEGRRHPHGEEADPRAANTLEAHLKQTAPVGTFPLGRTPEGADDLGGNVYDWTTSLYGSGGADQTATDYPYPFDASDGRGNLDAPHNVRRVLRGCAWINLQTNSPAYSRNYDPPVHRLNYYGLRVVVEGT